MAEPRDDAREDPVPPRRRRPWPIAVVFLVALATAVLAWPFFDVLEGDHGGRAVPGPWLWPTFLVTVAAVLAGIVALANHRTGARPARWAGSAGAAVGGFAIGFVVATVVVLSTFGGCGLSPESASWTDPQMHAGLEGRHGLPVTVRPPEEGFGFRDADLDSRWADYDLVQVAWGRGIGYDFGPVAILADPGIVRAAYLDLEDFRAHRQELLDFLAGFGGTPQEAGRIVDAMEANGTTGETATRWDYPRFIEYSAAIPLEWEPRVAWESFCCIGQQPTDDPSHGNPLGRADLRVGHWNFVFALQTKHLEGPGFTIDTDAAGRVEFEGLGNEDEDSYKTDVRRTLGRLDLPQPDREGMHLQGSIC